MLNLSKSLLIVDDKFLFENKNKKNIWKYFFIFFEFWFEFFFSKKLILKKKKKKITFFLNKIKQKNKM